MYYLTILDYDNGTVDQYNLQDHFSDEQLSSFQTEDFLEFITSEGYRLDKVNWMSHLSKHCLLYTSPSPRDRQKSRMPSSA